MNVSSSVVLSDVHLTLTAGSGPVNILNGITLRVGQGETLAVVGPSGSGKTTMLMLMAGLERPTSGQVQVAGVDLTALNEDALSRFRREHLGIVFQAFHLIPTMTAVENAALPLEFAHHPKARSRALEALEQVGLGHRAGHYPSQLSGGEQQRVALARAFAARPRIILADEPTGNLDEETGARVMELLFTLQAEENATLVLVTHDRSLAKRCDRVASMHSGRMEA
ncbi:ABC transporter ATP-binding protein [Desulfomicrobium sp. ZS1]|jgi:putative ABC transport system ATP-binding protein|uniref:ABC transporter ATP-binding protein n=1 Tax=Desulfomicrobium sp. ZS1 TaxID=2952228 RepID=UPI0020B263DC|nr:ABC transporter ATP-binding protein [Desulfomicrobium sp. ZS1]UTF51343.1 ABC transporter ATP-binding protein [Desulfomicrobium sp. ZS1]